MSPSSNIRTPPACSPYDPESPYFSYGYQPSLVAGIVFFVVFGAILLVQLTRLLQTKAWWMVFFVIGVGLETLGWIARAIAHACAYSRPINTMQVTVLIMGPAWTQAGVYIALWLLLKRIGMEKSPIKPAIYLWGCVIFDTVCLGLQAAGGGIAGTASTSYKDPAIGTWIMVAGIVAQLGCGIVFLAITAAVLWRGRQQLENRTLRLVSLATIVSTLMMILRGFYRSIELWQVWTGYLMTHERFIIALDATPMVIAMGILAILNPGFLLRKFDEQVPVAEKVHDAKNDMSGTFKSNV